MLTCADAEAKPLLSKSDGWEPTGCTQINVQVDSLNNGLNRREKASDLQSSDMQTIIPIALPSPKREESKLPPEKLKTLVAFVFLLVCMLWTLTILAIVHDRIPDRTKYPPLPDIFFDFFPPIDWALNVSEVIIIASVGATILMILLHKHRHIVLRRCFFIIGLLYFMRGITMFVTQVPIASTTYYCSPKANLTTPLLVMKRVLHMFVGFGLSINGRHICCGDYIYSGHTVILTLVYLIFKEYYPKKWIQWIVWSTSCTGVFMVLLSRGHYTVDVVIGYYISSRVFWIYHTIANNENLKIPGHNNFLSRLWWFCFFTYFEKGVNGIVPYQFDWPLSWPRGLAHYTRISYHKCNRFICYGSH